MAYSFAQLEALWVEAGGPRKVAPVMAAIGLAESGGRNIKQKGQPARTTGWGIWQITPGGPALLNPRRNAAAAVAKYRSQGLRAWTTYTTGAYKAHLQAGVNPAAADFGILGSSNFAGVDQGVDFRGQGPVPALDPIVVTSVRRVSIIEGGTWPLVGFRFTAGPYKGRYGYLMENFTPKVKVGQHLKRGQPIGIANGSYPYVEYGFASGPEGSPLAPLGGDPHAPTPAGTAFASYIGQRTGSPLVAPPDYAHRGSGGSSDPIAGAAGAVGGAISGAAGAVGGAAGSALGIVTAPVRWTEAVASFLGKLLDPHFWLRGLEIMGGIVLVMLGLYLIARQMGAAPSPSQVASVAPVGRAARLSDSAAAEMQLSAGARAARPRTRRTVHRHYLEERPKERQISDPQTNEIPF